ncbi:tRNA epoxyqueuosine(34) reductase QueG [Terribacillus saccharophilus]|uniref:tRNA epoxyqueuosine(34) reductase QueG n=1 Tax=Terribacillus saccharophilus TaxID=361277 RepID=A0A268HA03_9BACI|nr:tRNA epoxyqueuosine(34) reductase QueG [Terribacillus saccharophilus]PAD34915.1 tRNA epoxyqueuosine(34) reductase QueG [Terribacillus saccharophilus]PAD95819.1 tRNA epoxyqueuosine(34) reductase QueG [Terribacillus saccharophilus]PAD99387.1 tRNA epoxyqueuosine(34) reductase QueG [Terribacillus saccharophilus]PAE06699.1 tRNA epoxyqueuosine(34) reductase QueG [Terribacillus saccharophilus]
MDAEQLKQELIAYSKEIGVDKIRFTTADVFQELKERLKQQQENNYQSGFEKGTIEERTEPKKLMPSAQSIIAIALAYPSRLPNAPKSTKEEPRGLFCRASWGMDYHEVLRDRMNKLTAFLSERVEGFTYRSMVDTGELSDRAVAERAGIGFSAKNSFVITPEFGSYVYLGEVITNIPFLPDEAVEDSCGTCTKCIDSCPTGALVQGGQLNAQRCIAYLTQTKDFLPDEFRSKIGNRIYGCDTCQLVCPKNKGMDFHLHEEMEPDPEVVKPLLKPLLKMSNKEFKAKFGLISGSWRGKKPIQRNAILAIAHYKTTSAVPDLIELMEQDPRPVIRGTAAWAIGKIGLPEGFDAVRKAMDKEQDDQVLEEMRKGLQFEEEYAESH